jgi:hypothetical protein
MKRVLSRGVALLIICLAGCSKGPAGEEKPPVTNGGEKEPAAAGATEATNREGVVRVDAATQKRIGLEVAAVKAESLSPEIKAYGSVLNVTALATSVSDLATTSAASEASSAEVQRLRTLASQNNASERALQTAQAAAARDQAAVEAARLKLLADWGGAIASRKDLPQFVESLATLQSVLLRLEVPAGAPLSGEPLGARVAPAGNEHNLAKAELVGPAPSVDAQLQGRDFFFLLTTNTLRLAPGLSVTGFLDLPGGARDGVIVPSQAILRHAGLTWVYVQTGEELFVRKAIGLDTPLEQGWFVTGGLKPGDRVVVIGAQELLSQELNPGEE